MLATQDHGFSRLIASDFYINELRFNLYLDDEYDDRELDSQLLNVVLALNSLDHLQDASDYLVWCNQLNLNPAVKGLLDYYKEAIKFSDQCLSFFSDDKINSFISGLDFELNAGAAQYLRKH